MRETLVLDHDGGHICSNRKGSSLMHREAEPGDDQSPPCINNALPLALLSTIFGHLECHDLVRCQLVCRLWNVQAKEHDRAWTAFFGLRWQPPRRVLGSWQQAYASKVTAAKGYAEQCRPDSLFGHGAAVRACCLLPGCNAVVTGSEDQTVRVWDLEAGLPLAASRPLGSKVRCVAADEGLVVCATTCDPAIRVWRPSEDAATGDAAFDMAHNTRLRGGHAGPVTRLSLTDRLLCSSSLDFTARLWKRGSKMRCISVLHLGDWVWDIVARGGHVLAAAGQGIRAHDVNTTAALRSYRAMAGGDTLAPLRVEGTRDDRLMFAGGGDGRVLCYDLRLAQSTPVATLLQDSRAVTSLAFEDPWLACGTATGVVSLVNVEEALRGPASGLGNSGARKRGGPVNLPKPRRQLQGSGGATHAVDLACGWLAVCGEASTVRTYRFSACGGAGDHGPKQWRSRVVLSTAASTSRALSSPLITATEPAHDCPPNLFNLSVEPWWEPITVES